ncbi:MAG: hypothetical protein IKO68_06165 [Oscillospiraceae bacterium]|nr:hypothetical protein [Oscillospiraceae bacterium]MBR4193998.1 hypothetical protein [Oscillospiraceae bacterium]MBR4656148.1 hypothetical protein [Oscillospiraceae bacterium]
MKHLFIVNPAAGKYDHTEELTGRIRALCTSRGLDYEIRVSGKPGDCTAITRQAAASGEEYRVYACGGDGTLNEVVCGAAGAANVAVTHWPCGSGNDFIKNFSEPPAFLEPERLLDAEEALLDLIQVGEDYSLSICSMGIDARIGTEIQKYKRLPLVSGNGAYNLSTVINLIKGIHRHYAVEINGETIDDRFTLICVCNGRFYGGGYEPVPEARPDDGKLEVLLVKKVSRLQVASLIGKYKAGRWAEFPALFRHFSTDRVTIRCDREEVVNLDGEARWGKDVEIRLSDKKLRFFYPRGLVLGRK